MTGHGGEDLASPWLSVGGDCNAGTVSGLAVSRWSDGDTVFFAVSGIGTELAGAASGLLMDYEQTGDQWRIGYPEGTPHLRRRLAQL
jgi:hypothetical protein